MTLNTIIHQSEPASFAGHNTESALKVNKPVNHSRAQTNKKNGTIVENKHVVTNKLRNDR